MSELETEPKYDYPTDDAIKVLSAKTINKTAKWWSAVLKFTSEYKGDKPQIAVYLWAQRGGRWKRVQKLTILPSAWPQLRDAIEEIVSQA